MSVRVCSRVRCISILSRYCNGLNFLVCLDWVLGKMQSSGWISDADPYGWFQWYCRFYQGRRCSDDARQISRWKGVAGPKGRFKSQLCNKIVAQAVLNRASTSTAIQDTTISPVIRQTLFHWGLLITEEVLDQHRKLQR